MIEIQPRARFAAIVLAVALIAALVVAAFRAHTEQQAKRVEIAMDYTDFVALARAYNYNAPAFLIALRRAGLTSLALTEELGSDVGNDGNAYAITGAALLNQARIAPLTDPDLAQLVRSGRIVRDAVYVGIYDRATFERYKSQLALHFEPKTIVVLRDRRPWLIELHSQIDYFNNTSLGIPDAQVALAKRLGLLVIPRFQNDERFAQPQIATLIDGVLQTDPKVSTVVFFGLRNQVAGYPDHLPDAAAVFQQHGARAQHPFNFGSIETYDDSQIQKGNDTLAKLIPGQTVRVQAIAKTELDKIDLDELVARYELGVRERNVRVAYLRPWGHQDGKLSIEATNVEMVKALADDLRSRGFRLGRATPIPLYRGNNALLVGVVTLAVPSLLVLLLGAFGAYRPAWGVAAYAATIALYAGGLITHHDMFARSTIALAGALFGATAAFLAFAPAFRALPERRFSDQLRSSFFWMFVATGAALATALVVVGLMSSPLAMEEIERFRGVKLVLALPPLIALALYIFDPRYDAGNDAPGEVFLTPVRLYQLLAGVAVIAAGVLLVMRSGNQSDIEPTKIELALRHTLTFVLSVRPRFKEFLLGYPVMLLIPALAPAHRRAAGWVLAICVGIGIGDIVDTFSHLHTPLAISLWRIANGIVIGAAIGVAAIAIYRRVTARAAIRAA